MARRVAWSKVSDIDGGLLANVGESLIHIDRSKFDALREAWTRIEAEAPQRVREYVLLVLSDAVAQWHLYPSTDFDVDGLDRIIADAVRGLQPSELTPVLELAEAVNVDLAHFLSETHQLLVETADLLDESTS